MPDAPTKTGLRVTGLIPNVVYYDAQNKPYYRKINAQPENPTIVQPEISNLTSITPEVKATAADASVNIAIKKMAQAENDARQGEITYNTLTNMIDTANSSGNANDYSKAMEYAENNRDSLEKVVESNKLTSLVSSLKDTAALIRTSNLATKLINDELESGHVTQARVYAEKYQDVLEKSAGKVEASKFLTDLKQAETETKTSGITLDKINKAIDAGNYTEARSVAESNRAVLEKTVGIKETADYITQIKRAESQSKTPARTTVSEPVSEYGVEDLTVSKVVRDVTEPVSEYLGGLMGTEEEIKAGAKKIGGEGAVGEAFGTIGMVGKGAYETLVPGTVELVGQVPTAAEYVIRHPTTTVPAAIHVGKQIVDSVITEAKENPAKLVGSLAGMYIGGKIISKLKVPEVVKKTVTKTTAKISKAIDEFGMSDIISGAEPVIPSGLKPKTSIKSISEFEPPNLFRDTSDKALKTAKLQKEITYKRFRAKEAESAGLARGVEEVGLAKEYISNNLQTYLKNYRDTIIAEVKTSGINDKVPAIQKQIDAAVKVEQTRLTKIPVIEARNTIESGTGIKAKRYLSKEFEPSTIFKDTSEKAAKQAKELKVSEYKRFRAKEAESAGLARGVEEVGLAKEYVTDNLQNYLAKYKENLIAKLEKAGKNINLPSVRKQIEASVTVEKERLTKSKMPVTKARDVIEKTLGTKARTSLDTEFESPNIFQPMKGSARDLQKKGIAVTKQEISKGIREQEDLSTYLAKHFNTLVKEAKEAGFDPEKPEIIRQIKAAVKVEQSRLKKLSPIKRNELIKSALTKEDEFAPSEFKSMKGSARDLQKKGIAVTKQEISKGIREQEDLSTYLAKHFNTLVKEAKEAGFDPEKPEIIRQIKAAVKVEQSRLKKLSPIKRNELIKSALTKENEFAPSEFKSMKGSARDLQKKGIAFTKQEISKGLREQENLSEYLSKYFNSLTKEARELGIDPTKPEIINQLNAAVKVEQSRLKKLSPIKRNELIKSALTKEDEFAPSHAFRDTSDAALKTAKKAKEQIYNMFKSKEAESEYLSKIRQDAANKIRIAGGNPESAVNVKNLDAVVKIEQARLRKFNAITRNEIIRGSYKTGAEEFGITEIKRSTKPLKKITKPTKLTTKKFASKKAEGTEIHSGKSGLVSLQKVEQKQKAKVEPQQKTKPKTKTQAKAAAPVSPPPRLYNVKGYDAFGTEFESVSVSKPSIKGIVALGLKKKQVIKSKQEFQPVQEVKPTLFKRVSGKGIALQSEFGVSNILHVQKPTPARKTSVSQLQQPEFEPVQVISPKQTVKQVTAQIQKPEQKIKPKQAVKPQQIAVPKPKPKQKPRQTVKPKQSVKQKPKSAVIFPWGEQKSKIKIKKGKGKKESTEFAPVEMPFENSGTKYKKQEKQKNSLKKDDYGI
jgi:HPt (histidine-containing phosphotransfer) domain-containing protein